MASIGPVASASTGWGTTVVVGPTGLASTASTSEVAAAIAAAMAAGTVVGVVGRHREVPMDNLERGGRDCHNENTYYRPADNPLHCVLPYHTSYTGLELITMTVPATAAAVGDAVVESNSYSGLYSNH